MASRAIGAWLLAAFFVGLPASCLIKSGEVKGNCTQDIECDDGNPCTEDTCAADGFCDHTDLQAPPEGSCPDGNPCTSEVCQQGQCANAPDDALVPNDGNECTDDTCSDGAEAHAPKTDNTPCGLDGALFCANGKCACTNSAECGISTVCILFECKEDACVSTSAPKDTLVDEAASDDCKRNVCDGVGNIVSAVDDTDFPPDTTPQDCKRNGCDDEGNVVVVEDTSDAPPDDGSICTTEGCNGEEPIVYTPANEGMACGAGQSCGPSGVEYQATAALTCNAGACVGGSVTPCGYFTCNAGNTDCRTTCSLDSHCIASAYCDVAAMTCKLKVNKGDVCSGGNQCTTGFCEDSVCCNVACGGTCKSCDLPGTVGNCTNIASGQDPDNECPDVQVCDGGGACAKPQGATCGNDSECLSNQCEDNICCNTGCSGDCRRCDLGGSTGICTNVPAGQQSGGCASGSACDGNNACKGQNGKTCNDGAQCLSGHCPAEGGGARVCCDTACNTTCQSCIGTKTGGFNGTCGFISANSDPDDECPGANNCNGSGMCN